MAHYVDGYVLVIPKKNVKAYKRMASSAGKVWRDHGALEYRECVGEDLKIKGVGSFLKLARAKPTETVVFAWVVYRSRSHRDAVNKKVMADPRMNRMMKKMKDEMPFDMKRMYYGGFETLVDLA